MWSRIKKVSTAATIVMSGLLLSSTQALADGGDPNPYKPHPPVGTDLAPDSYVILLVLTLLVAGTIVVSYGKYLKNKHID